MKLNGTYQLLVYADGEVDIEKITHNGHFWRDQHAGQNRNNKIGNKYFESVGRFGYLVTIITVYSFLYFKLFHIVNVVFFLLGDSHAY
jgi:hypothetical protein